MKKILSIVGIAAGITLLAAGCNNKAAEQPQTNDDAMQQSNQQSGDSMMDDKMDNKMDNKTESDSMQKSDDKMEDKMMDSKDSMHN